MSESFNSSNDRDLPSVSVVLTTYNRSSVLGETIESILLQSFEDFELIICDDNSTDDTALIAREFCRRDQRISYLGSPVRLGMPANLNRGIVSARGRYIANLHDGDRYHARLLERWFSALEDCEEAGFVFNAYIDLGEWFPAGEIMSVSLPRCSEGAELIHMYFRRWRFDSPVWGTTMVRKSAYDDLGLFKEEFGFLADVDMWLRISEKYHVAYVNEPLIGLPPREMLPKHYELDSARNGRVLIDSLKRRQLAHVIIRRARVRQSQNRLDRFKHEFVQALFVFVDYLYFAQLEIIKCLGLYEVAKKVAYCIRISRRAFVDSSRTEMSRADGP